MRFLIELWPALLPLIIYFLWMYRVRRKHHKQGNEIPKWVEGPWFWAVVASAAITILCLLFIGLNSEPVKGTYIPPHVENGQIVPGKIEREE